MNLLKCYMVTSRSPSLTLSIFLHHFKINKRAKLVFSDVEKWCMGSMYVRLGASRERQAVQVPSIVSSRNMMLLCLVLCPKEDQTFLVHP